MIKADALALRENLLRLVVDARQAMPDGGIVEISTALIQPEPGAPRGTNDDSDSASDHTLDRVQITIRDTGKGIRPSAKDRVFEPYYQSRPGNGNPGFSLALVYQFVALSGGSIEVEAVPGEGAAYLLRFPALAILRHPPQSGPQQMAVSA
jgi:signal transduction histidine kinase